MPFARLQDFLSQARVTFVTEFQEGERDGAEAQEASPWTSPLLAAGTYRSRVVTTAWSRRPKVHRHNRIWPGYSALWRGLGYAKERLETQLVVARCNWSEKDGSTVTDFIATEARFGAQIRTARRLFYRGGEGVWVWDTQGNRYLDCPLSLFSVEPGPPSILAACRTGGS